MTASPVDQAPASPGASHRTGSWQLSVLGGLQARSGDVLIARWPSRPTALLLVTLALAPERAHPREALIERLWPGAPPDAGRNRLRQALSTLRRLLQAPGAGLSDVLVASRHSVQLNGAALQCDAADFERALAEHRFADARALYGGELLPGIYDDWVIEARDRLAARFEALDSLAMSVGQPRPSAAPLAAPVPAPSALQTPAQPMQPMQPMQQAPPWTATPLLPAVANALLGRDAELQALLAQLRPGAGARLLTLTGPGGCGKTRLAIETARRAAGFELVVFVPLADCSSAAQAASQLRASLQLPPASTPPLLQCMQMLASRRALLVLDNFEQVEGGADLLRSLLGHAQPVPDAGRAGRLVGIDAAAGSAGDGGSLGSAVGANAIRPVANANANANANAEAPSQLTLFVTSRRAAGLDGEREVALAPLPTPAPDAGLEAVAHNASVNLFVQCARGVRADFQVTARNCQALAALCRALEGLPLAIELAAARARAFSVQEMQAALAQPGPEPFALLARSGARGRRGARHDSMRNAIAWSWRLLDAPAQDLLAALSVFRGGFTAAAAAAVTGCADARALLEGLAADSLVRVDAADAIGHDKHAGDDSGALRLRLLEVIREDAAARLPPARASALRAAHRAHFLRVAQDLPAGHAPPDAELPNFDQALRSAVADGHPASALHLALALQPHWQRRGIAPDLLALLSAAVDALPDAAPAVTAAAAVEVTEATEVPDAIDAIDAIDATHATDATHASQAPYGHDANADADADADAAAAAAANDAHDAHDAHDATHDQAPLLAAACTLLAQMQLDAGALPRAQALVARALASAGGSPAARAAALCAQVRVVSEGERRADGLTALLDEALALAHGAPALQALATELHAALAMRFAHDPPRAEALLQRAEQLYQQAGQPRSALLLRYERALCLRQMGRLRPALEQAELCEVECAHADDGVHRVRAIHLQGVILAEQRRWADALDAYRRCVREAWAHHVQYWLAFALWNHGRNLARLRRPELAARLMAFSERYWVAHFSALGPADVEIVRRVRRLVRAQIGRARTQQAWVDGAGWTLAQAVAASLAERTDGVQRT